MLTFVQASNNTLQVSLFNYVPYLEIQAMRASLAFYLCLFTSPTAGFMLPTRATIHTGTAIRHEPVQSPCSEDRMALGGMAARSRRRAGALNLAEGNSDGQDQTRVDEKLKPTSEDPSLTVKAAWYASELFGNIIGIGKPKGVAAPTGDERSTAASVLTREEASARLKTDFDRFYFVTGQMDLDLYEEDCTFADPFVAFQGRQRFKNNLDNLGSLMQDVSLDVTGWEDTGDSLKTKWRFRCVLGLPWRPSLAASGGTEFFFSDSGRIERHVESWNIKPIDALKQLIKPGRESRRK